MSRKRTWTSMSSSSPPKPRSATLTSLRGSATVSNSPKTVMIRTHSSLPSRLSSSIRSATWTTWSTRRETFRNSKELAKSDLNKSWRTCRCTRQSTQDPYTKSTYRSIRRTFANNTGSLSASRAATALTPRASLWRIQVHFTSKSLMYRPIAYSIRQTLQR